MKILFTTLIIALFSGTLLGQDSTQSFAYIKFQYAYNLSGGDLETRFGNFNSAGGEIGYKMANNFQFGLSGSILFSNEVKLNGLLADIINSNGDIIDADGELVKLVYEMRGMTIMLNAYKIIPIFNSNANSGLMLSAGVGYLQHKIKIDWRDGTLYQLEGDRMKGYDRFTSGIAFRQGVGFQYYGKSNLLNFYAGLEFNQAITYNRRGYNYDSRSFDEAAKQDIYSGIRLAWIIPFRKRSANDFYYY